MTGGRIVLPLPWCWSDACGWLGGRLCLGGHLVCLCFVLLLEQEGSSIALSVCICGTVLLAYLGKIFHKRCH